MEHSNLHDGSATFNLNAMDYGAQDVSIWAQMLYSILSNSPDGIVVVDNQDTVMMWNSGAEQIFGYSSDEIIGKSYHILVPPGLIEDGEIERLDDHTHRNGFVKTHATTRLSKHGRKVRVEITRTALKDKDGKVIGFSAVFRDITQQEQMQEYLRHSERLSAVGQLVTGLAHEIGTPLNIISGNAELILEEHCDAQTTKKGIKNILSATERVENLIKLLLQYASGREFKKESVSINKAVQGVLDFFDTQLNKEHIQADLRFAASDPCIEAVYSEIEEVFLNLVMNAWQAMEKGGILSVSTSTRLVSGSPRVILTVRDTGSGIRAEDMPNIFEPFFTTKDKKKGTGLGLYVTRNIIKKFFGDIEITSEPGIGTEVLVSFPMLQQK